MPTINENKNPQKISMPVTCDTETFKASLSSKIPAPKIVGIESKKENLAASSLFKPEKTPPEIVIPEREIPGKSAKICINPTIIAFLKEAFCIDFAYLLKSKLAIKRISAVKKKK